MLISTRLRGRLSAWKGALLARRKLVIATALATLALAGLEVANGVGSNDGEASGFALRGPVPADGQLFASALYQTVGVRMLPGHRVQLVQNGAVFDVLVDEIAKARSSLNIVMYIWEKGAASDRVVAAIVARARAGVRCRILVDAFGSPDFDEDVKGPLASAGCEVRTFRPIPQEEALARNHRKIAVIDGRVAITGGFGIRDGWLGDGRHEDQWRDANALFSGPAVADAQQAFAENWQEAGGALLPMEDFTPPDASGSMLAAFVSSTASPVVTRAERLTQLMIASARTRLWIANAYFVPSRPILELLGRKASEGVDVRILVPGKKSDSKTSFGVQQMEYGALLGQGVRVWEYLPAMMHAKTMLVDEGRVLIGSVNLDPLSLNTLEEGALIVQDVEHGELAPRLAESFLADCSHAKELTRD